MLSGVIDRYLKRSLNRDLVRMDRRNAIRCLQNARMTPDRAEFWLSEAARYEARASRYEARFNDAR